MTKLEWTDPEDVEVGGMADVPFRMRSAVIVVRCHVLDRRVVYGRVEYQIGPVAGRGTTWVQEASFDPDSEGVDIRKTVVDPYDRRRPKLPKPIEHDSPEQNDEIVARALSSRSPRRG